MTDGSAEEKKTCDEDITEDIKDEVATENAGRSDDSVSSTDKAQDNADGADKTGEESGSGDTDESRNGEQETNRDACEAEEDIKTQHLRLMADFQNYKRRSEEARAMSYSHGREDLITDLLPVIDNFERALGHKDDCNDNFVEGMGMIFKQMMEVLDKAGLREIEALGEDFDPNVHDAVMTETGSDYERNKVTEVMQKGYKLNDKVIRPSMVKVAN